MQLILKDWPSISFLIHKGKKKNHKRNDKTTLYYFLIP